MAAVTRGQFVWHELLATDADAAVGFYEKAIGWRIMPWGQDPNYRLFAWKGVPMAGLMALPEEARQAGAPPHWLTYVAVPDVDATLSQAAGLGGRTVFGPMTIPTVGRVAGLADPQGAVIGVYRPEQAGMGSEELALGDFSWHELAAGDWKAAWEFYRALFGWERDSEFDMGPEMGTYWMFRRPGGSRTLGGMYNRPPEVPVAHWLPYVLVASADRTAELVARHGGRVLHGPMEVPGGSGDRIAMVMDPHGAAFAVHARAAQRSAKPAAKPAPKPKKKAAKKPAATKAVTKKPVKKAAGKKPAKKPVKKSARRPVKKR
jgi:predicted enzyme related to lactoylglutathione lyase